LLAILLALSRKTAMLFLTEDDVRRLLTMDAAIAAVEAMFRDRASGRAQNISRGRAKTNDVMLHLLGGATGGMVGYKAYSTSRQGASFQVGLFDGVSGEPLALMQADALGQIRTGAASGVATKYLANPTAARVGLFGTGKQARTQAWAVSRVRKLDVIRVFSPNEQNRRAFAEEMTPLCGCPVEPVARPEDAVRDCHIVITATASKTPVFDGDWLTPGTHLNVIGSNFLAKAEIDVAAIRRCSLITVDDVEQAKLEAGDFVAALQEGALAWENVHGLEEVIAGRRPRVGPADITLFKSLGLGAEDVAVAAHVYQEALRQNVGLALPI
jgi:alanine dehydrogenase